MPFSLSSEFINFRCRQFYGNLVNVGHWKVWEKVGWKVVEFFLSGKTLVFSQYFVIVLSFWGKYSLQMWVIMKRFVRFLRFEVEALSGKVGEFVPSRKWLPSELTRWVRILHRKRPSAEDEGPTNAPVPVAEQLQKRTRYNARWYFSLKNHFSFNYHLMCYKSFQVSTVLLFRKTFSF